jgi:UDP-N-acetylglucosamine--N-acetylmuramyl-(pentapeptide) pyrophosphoryl-undecaprenol N-acetylglucosamine transferase
VVISRSGACSVSELCLVGKPTLFVPSPNVAEDHQTKNAQALVDKDAAILVPDAVAVTEVMERAEALLNDQPHREVLSKNIASLAVPDAADRIVNEIIKLW